MIHYQQKMGQEQVDSKLKDSLSFEAYLNNINNIRNKK